MNVSTAIKCDPVDQVLVYTWPSKVTFAVIYGLIFIVGLAGNIITILAVARRPKMRGSVTNLFILNLALSDVVMCLFAVPITPIYSFTGEWYFGRTLCALLPFSLGVSVYISTLTLTIIAVDRFVVIVFPFRSRMRTKACVLIILIIDALSCAVTAPYAYHMEIRSAAGNASSSTHCVENWPNSASRTAYGTFTNLSQFVLPFCTIIFCYSAVMRRLQRRRRQRGANRTCRSAQAEENERKRNRRTNRMLIFMGLVFGVCWLPLNAINFITDLGVIQADCWKFHDLIFFCCHTLAMSSTCYNPFLYGWLNESFRKEFIAMIPLLGLVCSGGKLDHHHHHNHRDEVDHVDGRSDERGMTTRGPFDPKHAKSQGDEIEMQNLMMNNADRNNDRNAKAEPGLDEICHL